MLTLIALSAVLMQDPPVPPAPPAPPEIHTRVMVMGADGPAGLDRDGDGQISREEFSAPMNDHFARMDKDSDGRLSAEEMAAGHDGPGDHVFIRRGPGGESGPGAHRLGMGHPRPPGAHAEHDVHAMVFAGRGEGGRHAIHLPRGGEHAGRHDIIVRQLGGPNGEHAMDADNDGRISEAEFTGPLREAFTRMDADHSGFIEEGERGQGHDIQVFTHRIETRQGSDD